MIGEEGALERCLIVYVLFRIMLCLNCVLCFLKVKALQASLTVAEMEIIEYKVEIEHLKCALLSREVEFVVLFSEEEPSTL